ncbi:hypothetical protein N7456_010576 [Penicillium angulare]|uniref:Cytochrome P450 n=1 Tax=Penicillium angulare TaxID=116970 RepID=A0A9W9F6Y9_9EURO|nr:hypothetical protein N7456_010576 [Penicillium angulare]
MYAHLLLLIPVLWVSFQVLLKLGKAISSPLRDIPGPFWTRFTSLWYFNQVRRGKFEQMNIRLHEKYGPIVRLSPDHYSISDISAIKTVYAAGSKFPKSAWYDGWRPPHQWTVFADRDMKRNADTRRQFASLYAMSSVVNYEPFADRCIDILFERLDEFARHKKSLDLAHWFQCYAFDVIGDITFGHRFGFLDQGKDIENAMNTVHKIVMYSSLVGIYPKWHPWLFGPMSKISRSGAAGRAYLGTFVREKMALLRKERSTNEKPNQTGPESFMAKMMQVSEQDPTKVTEYHLVLMGQLNVAAGSDTTSISLSGMMWYLIQNPEALGKLRDEIDEFTQQGRCSHAITFKETQEMPYLQAVIKEALRMHAATGLPMWREVPAGGAQISGRFFPAGTVVGVNSWVPHYDEKVFPNATTFSPERWLEAESEPERLKEMNQMYMPFGLGSRTCIGKHISILEMSKLIPRLARDYDLTSLQATMNTENHWFVRPASLEVDVSPRRRD